jgi:hypothetical protein
MKITLIIFSLIIVILAIIAVSKQFIDDFQEYKNKILFIISLAASFVIGGLMAYYLS